MRSFRARLTLWNVLVLGLVLASFALALTLSNQARAAAGIDRELDDRARQALGPPGGRRPPFNGRPGGPPPMSRLGQMGFDQDVIRMADLRRPRIFSPQGEPDGRQANDKPLDPKGLQLALAGKSTYANVEWNGATIRVLSRPQIEQGRVTRVAQVGHESGELDRLWQSQLATISILVPLALIIAAAGALFLTGRVMRPIAQMREAASSITEADLSRRLEVQGQDEFAELGHTFNHMVARLEIAFSQLSTAYSDLAEASENQRRFTADASHELRTPLTRLRLAIDVASAPGATGSDRDRAIAVGDSTTRLMSRLVQELLLLAKADAGQMHLRHEKLDLRLVASDAVSALPPASAERVSTEFAREAVSMEGDADALGRLATNLLENALRHTAADKRVSVRVTNAGEAVQLLVEDEGEGIAAAHLPRLTERFYRVDGARSAADGGAGLGLAICETIVKAHGGTLTITSERGKGTQVLANFPRNHQFK